MIGEVCCFLPYTTVYVSVVHIKKGVGFIVDAEFWLHKLLPKKLTLSHQINS